MTTWQAFGGIDMSRGERDEYDGESGEPDPIESAAHGSI